MSTIGHPRRPLFVRASVVAFFLIAQSPLSFSSRPTLRGVCTEIALYLFALSNYRKKKKKKKGRKERKRSQEQKNFCGRAISHPVRRLPRTLNSYYRWASVCPLVPMNIYLLHPSACSHSSRRNQSTVNLFLVISFETN